MRRFVVIIQEWTEQKLRHLCGRITPQKRLAVLLTMFAIFGITSIYVLVSAIYEIGRNEGQRIEIEHIEGVELSRPSKLKDSINQLKINDNGREQD